MQIQATSLESGFLIKSFRFKPAALTRWGHATFFGPQPMFDFYTIQPPAEPQNGWKKKKKSHIGFWWLFTDLGFVCVYVCMRLCEHWVSGAKQLLLPPSSIKTPAFFSETLVLVKLAQVTGGDTHACKHAHKHTPLHVNRPRSSVTKHRKRREKRKLDQTVHCYSLFLEFSFLLFLPPSKTYTGAKTLSDLLNCLSYRVAGCRPPFKQSAWNPPGAFFFLLSIVLFFFSQFSRQAPLIVSVCRWE